jgi:hypothetical protein
MRASQFGISLCTVDFRGRNRGTNAQWVADYQLNECCAGNIHIVNICFPSEFSAPTLAKNIDIYNNVLTSTFHCKYSTLFLLFSLS